VDKRREEKTLVPQVATHRKEARETPDRNPQEELIKEKLEEVRVEISEEIQAWDKHFEIRAREIKKWRNNNKAKHRRECSRDNPLNHKGSTHQAV
jgi:hypothetical protein